MFQLNASAWYFFLSKVLDLLDTVSNRHIVTLRQTINIYNYYSNKLNVLNCIHVRGKKKKHGKLLLVTKREVKYL